MKKQKQCPECGSFKIQSVKEILAAFAIAISSVGSCVTFVLFIPLVPVVMLFGVLLLIITPFVPPQFICKNCNYKISL